MDHNHYKKTLSEEKEKLIREIGFYKKEDPYLNNYRGSETFDDAITDNEGHDRVVATKLELESLLTDVEAALDRIENGTYGVCLNCHQEISPERLEAMPTASLCTSCQGKKKRA